MNATDRRNLDALRRQIHDLSPWHLDIEVVPGLRTGDAASFEVAAAQNVSFVHGEDEFKTLMRSVYPSGLDGRSFLDVACNCGGYSFWARDLDAGRCLGFDAARTLDPPSKVPRRRSSREAAPRIPARRRDEARRVRVGKLRHHVLRWDSVSPAVSDGGTSKRGRRHRRTPLPDDGIATQRLDLGLRHGEGIDVSTDERNPRSPLVPHRPKRRDENPRAPRLRRISDPLQQKGGPARRSAQVAVVRQ